MESFYNRHNTRPISLGPGTPWPNRAEAAIRMLKRQISLMLRALSEDPALADITYRQLIRQAALARNSTVTLGGVTHIELASVDDLQTQSPLNTWMCPVHGRGTEQ